MHRFFTAVFALACTVLIIVLNVAYQEIGSVNGYNIVAPNLFIIRVHLPNTTYPAPRVVTPGEPLPFNVLLYLNSACAVRDYSQAVSYTGQACQAARVGATYTIRSHPNTTVDTNSGLSDSPLLPIYINAICYPHPFNSTLQNTLLQATDDLPCWVNPETDTGPTYTIATGAVWAFYLFGTILSFFTIMASYKAIAARLPLHFDLAASAGAGVCFLLGSVTITGQACAAVAWVNAQHSDVVGRADVGWAFLFMGWLTVALSWIGPSQWVWRRWRAKRKSTRVEVSQHGLLSQ